MKNKILSLLFFVIVINSSSIIYSMKTDSLKHKMEELKQKTQEEEQKLKQQQNKLQLEQENLSKQFDELEQIKKTIESEKKYLKEAQEKQKNKLDIAYGEIDSKTQKLSTAQETLKTKEQLFQNSKDNFEKNREQHKKEQEKFYSAETKAERQREKDKLDYEFDIADKKEKIEQTIQATITAQNNNSFMRQVTLQTLNGLSKGVGSGVGNSIVAVIQKELEFLYSWYRPTPQTLLNEIDTISKIIQVGINNIGENHAKQLKLLQDELSKNPSVAQEISILKENTIKALNDLKKLETSSRNRLMELCGYRDPNFKENRDENPSKNIFTEDKEDIKKSPPIKKPGRIKRITAFVTTATFGLADFIAKTLPINSSLDKLTKLEALNKPEWMNATNWINANKTEISRTVALGLVATTLALLYKSYSWYYNEERLLACEAVIQLEEQKKQIAEQFKKELEKATMSKEEKAKLQIAYENYMQELQDEIDEQKVIAGYNVSKKLFALASAAAAGVVGLMAYRYYILNPNILSQLSTQSWLSTQKNNTDQTPQNISIDTDTNVVPTTDVVSNAPTTDTVSNVDDIKKYPADDKAPGIVGLLDNSDDQKETKQEEYDPTEYNKLTDREKQDFWPNWANNCRDWLQEVTPEERARIDHLKAEHAAHLKRSEELKQAEDKKNNKHNIFLVPSK